MTLVGVIIQARMGSSRLPGKVMMPMGNTTLLGYILERLTRLPSDIPCIIATSDLERDEPIAAWCREHGAICFQGSEADVLDRYYQCAKTHRLQHIVRLTGDNPFPDVEELWRLIRFHREGGYDYSHNLSGLPIGVGAEIFTFTALEQSSQHAERPEDREHVNEYIQRQPDLFYIGEMAAHESKQAPDVRLTVDTPEDYAKAQALANALPQHATTEALIDACLHSA